jgi:signal transduction histidine kinase
MKIRNKLALQFSIIVASILLILSVGIYYFSATFRKVEFRDRLEMRALSDAKLLFDIKEVDYKLLKIFDKNTASSLFDLQVLILDSKNRIVYASNEADSAIIKQHKFEQISDINKISFTLGESEGIGFVYNSKENKNYKVIAWAVDKVGFKQLEHLRLILICSFLIGIIIIGIAGLIFAWRSLKPISRVVNQVENITASNLNLRLDTGNGHDEIAQLSATFNRMLQRLEDAFKMQRNFVSNASHELRTPLTSITGQIEVALLSSRQPEEYEKILKSLLEDIKTLNSLSNGLLDLAQSSIDTSALKMTQVRIDELLFESQTLVKRHNPDYSISIDFNELPDDYEKLTIHGNSNLLKAAFNNLFDNACKFSEDHKADVKIISGSKDLTIVIKDSGIGIPEDELINIFEPFYRARNSRFSSGHGIGLSLSKKIIGLHHGVLSVSSKENIGTTIKIQFII